MADPRVFVVEDDAAVRRFICQLLSSVGLRPHPFETARTFLESHTAGLPGCVLLDVRMPDMSGLELQAELAKRDPELPVIILTGHATVPVAVHAMKAGAFDFIEKPFNNDILLDRVQKAVAHSMRSSAKRQERARIESRIASLTARERQILELVVRGETNKGMARHLAISEKTVEIHRANMMTKMGAHSLAGLLRML